MKAVFPPASLVVLILLLVLPCSAQDAYLDAEAGEDERIYPGGATYPVTELESAPVSGRARNLVLLIADGMGLAQLQAGLVANEGELYMTQLRHMGLVRTASLDSFRTDSAAAGTAIASGVKARNGVLGLDPEGAPVDSILHQAEDAGLATGLVATAAITHATPAAFIAHQSSRNHYEAIAADFLETDIDVFIGGGLDHFTIREDGRDLVSELKEIGYRVVLDRDSLDFSGERKLAALTAPVHNPRVAERGDYLQAATRTALQVLEQDPDGFFLMIEGSQVDWGGHASSTVYIVEEMLDFDRAVGLALQFAARDGETLVVVTSDHETGGMAILEGDTSSGRVKAGYATGGHTGLMVPVFAFGPGAEAFTGFMDNTELNRRLRTALFPED
jgi:alkaline phosphatase